MARVVGGERAAAPRLAAPAASSAPAATAAAPRPAAAYGRRRPTARVSLRRAASSIRVRIVFGYFLLMAVALTAAIGITRQVQSARIERDVEMELRTERSQLERLARRDNPQTGEGWGRDVRALFMEFRAQNVAGEDEAFYTIPFTEDGRPDLEGVLKSFQAPRELIDDRQLVETWSSFTHTTIDSYETPVGTVRAIAVPVVYPTSDDQPRLNVASGDEPGAEVLGVYVGVRFTDVHYRDLNDLTWLLVLAGLAVLALTTMAAWWLAGRIIAPVRQLTRTARAITHSNLSARIPVVGRSELAELGTTFNEMVDRLENGVRAQRQFLNDVAHDLRTPITIAQGHLEVLGDDPEERDEAVAVVLDELDRMGRAVSDLLVLAKAEQPDFLRLQPVDYGDLAVDLIQRASALGPRTWKIDDAPRPGVVVGVADSHRLIQAVLNLAANAVEHTTDGDEIGIGVAAAAPADVERSLGRPVKAVRLWVRDHGPGIDTAAAGVLFQRYGRGHGAGSNGDGMGLGLSIVDAIARAHGGGVHHSPTPGGGATFTMLIPLASRREPAR